MHMDGVTGENNQQAAAPGTSSGASASASTVAPPIPAMPDEELVAQGSTLTFGGTFPVG